MPDELLLALDSGLPGKSYVETKIEKKISVNDVGTTLRPLSKRELELMRLLAHAFPGLHS
jgi:DNA-binding NarL/FixJ family response regulator